jgi:hypothetical protein
MLGVLIYETISVLTECVRFQQKKREMLMGCLFFIVLCCVDSFSKGKKVRTLDVRVG